MSRSIQTNIEKGLHNYKIHFSPNLDILTSISGDFSHGQAQNGGKFWVQFDPENQDQSIPETRILTKMFCTHPHADPGNDNTQRPTLASGKKEYGECLKYPSEDEILYSPF